MNKSGLKKIASAALAAVTAMTAISASALGIVSADVSGARGDANQNGTTDIRDCAYIARMLAEGKGDALPENADYNLDGKANVSDAANLARAISCSCVQGYNPQSVIPDICIGMSESEVMETVGTDYIYKVLPEDDLREMDRTTYYYNVDSLDHFGIDMPAVMFFEFTRNSKLYNYGYQIGCTCDSDFNFHYSYSKSELVSAYNSICSVLQQSFGKGIKNPNSWMTEAGVLSEYIWQYTDFGQIWFIVGTDLWGESGANHMTLSSCDESLL
ncbi:MAG: dockerin type I domain-containing protein [Porcipelethomonas sp.]